MVPVACTIAGWAFTTPDNVTKNVSAASIAVSPITHTVTVREVTPRVK